MGQENIQPQESIEDMMMRNIKDLGKFSYELEEKREQSLIEQSSQMLTAFSIFSAVILVIVPFIVDLKIVSVAKMLFCTGIVTLVLITSLVLALLAQWRFGYQTMVNVNDILEQVKNESHNYQTQAQFDMQWKYQLEQIQVSKKKNNDKRVNLIRASMLVFLIAVALVISFAIFLTVLYL